MPDFHNENPTVTITDLGKKMALLCDARMRSKPDTRCATCIFRRDEYLASDPSEATITALSDTVQGIPHQCASTGRTCAGWIAMQRFGEPHVWAFWQLVTRSPVPRDFYMHLLTPSELDQPRPGDGDVH